LAAVAALLLSACSPKDLTLPEQPVDRAATCGIVALLAASRAGEFEPDTATAVSHRMSELQDQVIAGKWRALIPVCASAYPEVRAAAAKLPADRFEAQLACAELADFLATALASQEVSYGNELAAWSRMRRELNDALAPGLKARVGGDLKAQQRERRKALGAIARSGPPMAVMQQCSERFGSSSSG
jgi:hypothetical protein